MTWGQSLTVSTQGHCWDLSLLLCREPDVPGVQESRKLEAFFLVEATQPKPLPYSSVDRGQTPGPRGLQVCVGTEAVCMWTCLKLYF